MEAPPPAELVSDRESYREAATKQPVAFAGGRYVYGMAPAIPSATEIRRKAHRAISPLVIGEPR